MGLQSEGLTRVTARVLSLNAEMGWEVQIPTSRDCLESEGVHQKIDPPPPTPKGWGTPGGRETAALIIDERTGKATIED